MTPDHHDFDLRMGLTAPEAVTDPAAAPRPEPGPVVGDLADDLGAETSPRPRRRSLGQRGILFAGVACACCLGAGLGLWARPAMNERRVAVAAPEPEAPSIDPAARSLRIVVADGPAAPVGAPIETLREPPRPLFATLRPRQAGRAVMGQVPELARLEPKPLPRVVMPRLQLPKVELPKVELPRMAGPKAPDLAPLMLAAVAAPGHWLERLKPPPASATARVEAEPARAAQDLQRAEASRKDKALAEAQAERDAARTEKVRARIETAAREAQALKAQARRMVLAQAARAQQARLAKIQQAKLQTTRLAEARAATARAQQVRLARAKAEQAEKLRLAKAQKAESFKLAQAEAKGRAEARAEAKAMVLAEARDEATKRQRLEALVHTVQKALPHGGKSDMKTASLERKHAAKGRQGDLGLERASLRSRKAQHAAPPPLRSHPVVVTPPAASGLMKVSTPRCASRDPGAALVCADPSLSAADRQLAHAYQSARAAGVPDGQLQAQQQRWLAARAAAAREAPWAVRDVYLARIAELNGQAREAHTDGY